jgi:hypothetical protein
MFTVERYRAKAMEYSNLVRITNKPDELREFQKARTKLCRTSGQRSMGNRQLSQYSARRPLPRRRSSNVRLVG